MSQTVGQLLLKGLRQLPEEEQDEALTSLLETTFARSAWGRNASAAGPPFAPVDVSRLAAQVPSEGGDPGRWKVLPVRLPQDDYERLRSWCQSHDFSMAVVIRTLVERFLETQGREAPQRVVPDREAPDQAGGLPPEGR